MVASLQILNSGVMHKRLMPKENQFSYRLSHIVIDVNQLDSLSDNRWFSLERWGLQSFYRKDYGPCDGSSLQKWAHDLFREHAVQSPIARVLLVTMPRTLGYVFNPVSFWLGLDENDSLRAVLAEVHNTFGERHVYMCRNEDGSPIQRTSSLLADKLFHVSPFLERSGHYAFRFSLQEDGLGIWIDYYNKDGDRQLLTSMSGRFRPYTRRERLRALLTCPLVTFKTMAAIHWQALRLVLKGIRYVPKPAQLATRIVLTRKPAQNG